MKKETAVIVASVILLLVLSIWLVRILTSRQPGAGNAVNDTVVNVIANKTVAPMKPADISIEAMIENITTLFEQNVMGEQNPVGYGEEIGFRILNVTNYVERTELVRRYTDVLMSMPLAVGTYSERLNKLYNIGRMVWNWSDILYKIQSDPKSRIKLWVTLLGNFRDAAESGWKADASAIAALFAEKSAKQQLAREQLARKKFSRGGYRGLYASSGTVDTRRSDFIKEAIIELRNVVRLYNLCVPRIITYLPPSEQARIEKELEETVRKLEIEKLLEAMEKDVKR